jgi:hypothetical protein
MHIYVQCNIEPRHLQTRKRALLCLARIYTIQKRRTGGIHRHEAPNVKGGKLLHGIVHGRIFGNGKINGRIARKSQGVIGRGHFADRAKVTTETNKTRSVVVVTRQLLRPNRGGRCRAGTAQQSRRRRRRRRHCRCSHAAAAEASTCHGSSSTR